LRFHTSLKYNILVPTYVSHDVKKMEQNFRNSSTFRQNCVVYDIMPIRHLYISGLKVKYIFMHEHNSLAI
jgi:hypothetical protein